MQAPTTSSPIRTITAEERATFARDGVAHLPQVYPREWVEYLERQLVEIFDEQPDRGMDQRTVSGSSNTGIRVDMVALAAGLQSSRPGIELAIEGDAAVALSGRNIVETDAAGWHDGIRRHHVEGPLPEIVAALTGSAKINFYCDQLFLKEPGSRVRTPFHHDKPYFLVDGGDVAVCWVPVDTVTNDNGAMRYVAGSHRWERVFKPSDFVTETGTFPEKDGIDLTGLDTLPDIDEKSHNILTFHTEPGDVIIHHWATVHGSAGNTSTAATRRAASVRYATEGCTYFQRPSSPEPFRNTVGLNDGDPLESADRFPIVWPRASS